MTTESLFMCFLLCAFCVGAVRVGKDSCDVDLLVVYKLHVETHWSREVFPKQYPEWRPPAQWSRLVGRSHNSSYSLFRVGRTANDGLKMFSETGQTDGLVERGQGEDGVFDQFNGPSIPTGEGHSETQFFVNGNHTKVSVAMRIVPSPDWFVGLDSLQLCRTGYWVDSLSIQARPLDAGTDSGFTFTAPNWPTEPRQKISYITSQNPSHPANSFYYPEQQELPAIVTFRFYKIKLYQLSKNVNLPLGNNHVLAHNDLVIARQDDISNDVVPSIVRDHQQSRRAGKSKRRPVPCRVTEWSSWSACSVSCGIGEASRSRRVMKLSRRGGRPCPSLAETKWCGEHTDCPQRFFKW
ncbi:hypothetical protein L9F63_009130 [Diploptera punctata]|uniref:Spondin domain-containing protein n=1 Tax=Diploptera punctata TaxID=6984 RepID=A0AAD7Z268_DIPPU|nr:hypothetical protein L9F63_009130 [Diploptera punctata]